MLDYQELLAWLYAGAATVGPGLAKQATMDAYQGLKGAIVKVCGSRARGAADAVEAAPASESARSQLRQAIGTIPDADIAEVSKALAVLQGALQADPGAISAAETFGKIRLRLVSGGNVTIEAIEDASSIDVQSESAKDFTLSHVKMGSRPGN